MDDKPQRLWITGTAAFVGNADRTGDVTIFAGRGREVGIPFVDLLEAAAQMMAEARREPDPRDIVRAP